VSREVDRLRAEVAHYKQKVLQLQQRAPQDLLGHLAEWSVSSDTDGLEINATFKAPLAAAEVIVNMLRMAAQSQVQLEPYLVTMERMMEEKQRQLEGAMQLVGTANHAAAQYRRVLEHVRQVLSGPETWVRSELAETVSRALQSPAGHELAKRVRDLEMALEEKRADVAAELIQQMDEEDSKDESWFHRMRSLVKPGPTIKSGP
jgi:hypothetical protein